MYSFKNDYSEGAHPNILNALIQTNMEQAQGYGYDKHSLAAISHIQHEINDTSAYVHFITGGTQTNLITIGAFLRPHEACVAACTGHIAVHEAGAIECTGHKVITVDTPKGKLSPEDVQSVLDLHGDEHMVKPKLVYISNPTELGTVYTLDELKALSTHCHANDLILYCDGARLGTALCIKEAGINLANLYELTDAFFIGGTKIGALAGEALVIRTKALQADMNYHIKQRGGLLAKGKLLGIQFEELFKSDLYIQLAQHSIDMAQKLVKGFEEHSIEFLVEPQTNQIFPILNNSAIEHLQNHFDFYVWKKINEDQSAIRLITSWATPQSAVDLFLEKLAEAQ